MSGYVGSMSLKWLDDMLSVEVLWKFYFLKAAKSISKVP